MKVSKLIVLFLFSVILKAQTINFNDYFTDQTMRIDYFHIGDANSEIVTLDQAYQYGTWAGSLNNLSIILTTAHITTKFMTRQAAS